MSVAVASLPTLHDELATHASVADAAPSALPAAPRSVEETGLPPLLLHELVLKAMQQHGLAHLHELSSHLKLGAALLETLFAALRKEQFVEVRHRGTRDGDAAYALTQAGRARAADALARNQYCGAAPVPLDAYAARVQRQSVCGMTVTRQRMAAALADVVIGSELRDRLGAALNSHRAVMVYGPAGAGKTFLCQRLARLLGGSIAVPHAVEVGGEIVRVHDPLVHRPAPDEPPAAPASLDGRRRSDARWTLCERPMVVAGGELTLDALDLVFDARAGYYQAPPHFKANGGIFLVDDLGRQLVTPRQLLNRWIHPMEHGHDYLMLRNGSKFRIPFDALLLFSTNLAPDDVADEAFLRRIGHKIEVGELALDDYRRVFAAACAQHRVPYDDAAFASLLRDYHARHARALLACYPRDLVARIAEFAAYLGQPPRLDAESLQRAWHSCFANRPSGLATRRTARPSWEKTS